MKRLIIICEGITEKQFCAEILYTHFFQKGIIIETPLTKRAHGGFVSWEYLKRDINNLLKGDRQAYVTLFIDLYGLHKGEKFPGWADALKKKNIYDRVTQLEIAMQQAVDEHSSHRFIPNYIIHEFEGLLFNDISIINEQFEVTEIKNKIQFEKIFTDYPNPEEINEGSETAPSKRLEKHIIGYKKVLFANRIANAIGLEAMRKKCRHFNEWIEKLENI